MEIKTSLQALFFSQYTAETLHTFFFIYMEHI